MAPRPLPCKKEFSRSGKHPKLLPELFTLVLISSLSASDELFAFSPVALKGSTPTDARKPSGETKALSRLAGRDAKGYKTAYSEHALVPSKSFRYAP